MFLVINDGDATNTKEQNMNTTTTDQKHLIAITASYVPASNCRGSRIKLHLVRFGMKKFIPYDHTFNSANKIAIAWLEEKGIKITHEADGVDLGSILLARFEQVELIQKTFAK